MTGIFYQNYIDKAPLFAKNDVLKLSEFIKQHVKFGDYRNVMYQIEHGKIRPSKGIADAIARMIEGNEEFVMIDDQKVVYERIAQLISKASPSSKQVVIVEGGLEKTAMLTTPKRSMLTSYFHLTKIAI
jgi:hypothetical protein